MRNMSFILCNISFSELYYVAKTSVNAISIVLSKVQGKKHGL